MTTYQPLPFATVGTIIRRPDTLLAEFVPCSVWPTRTRVTASGLTYDHEGEVPLAYYSEVAQANVTLVLETVEYMIVDAQANVYLPHVALLLRRSRPEGA